MKIKKLTGLENIWIVHPGKHRKFFSHFRDNNLVFLDFPGANFSTDDFSDTENLKRKILISQNIKGYLDADMQVSAEVRQAINLVSTTEDASLVSSVGSIKSLYSEAKVGDLVVVTANGYYEKYLIGEITSEFSSKDRTYIKSRYGAEPLNYRNILWFKDSFKKSDLSRKLADTIINRKAIIKISEEALKKEIYDKAYSIYTKNNVIKLEIGIPKYDDRSVEDVYDPIYIVKEIERIYADRLNSTEREFLKELKVSFNSPGKLQILSPKLLGVLLIVLISKYSGATINFNVVDSFNMQIEHTHPTSLIDTLDDNEKSLFEDILKTFPQTSKGEEVIKKIQKQSRKTGLRIEKNRKLNQDAAYDI